MELVALSSDRGNSMGSFVMDTDAKAASRRGEEILGLPILVGKRWSTEAMISPAEAKLILLCMPAQRPLYVSTLRKFVAAIKGGTFKTTHQGIAFNRSGYLIDGQHRLNACIEADKPILVMVSFNQDDDVFDSLDRGKSRSQADDIVCSGLAEGHNQSKMLAAASRQLFHYDNNRVPWTNAKPTLDEVKELLNRHPHLEFAVAFALRKAMKGAGVSGSSMAAFYALMREANLAKADVFLQQVVSGEGIYSGDPAWVFREYGRADKTRRNDTDHLNRLVAFVRCWNAFYEGRKLSKTHTGFKKGDVNFPRVAGLKK